MLDQMLFIIQKTPDKQIILKWFSVISYTCVF